VLLSLGLTAISFADGDDDWQDLDFNINKLNELNQCMSCDLRSTNFNGLNFTGANLTGANLTDANLSGAKLKGAILDGAFFCNTQTPWGIDNSSCQ